MWAIQSWIEMKVGSMAQSFVIVQKKLLPDNIDNHPSIEDGSKVDKALTMMALHT